MNSEPTPPPPPPASNAITPTPPLAQPADPATPPAPPTPVPPPIPWSAGHSLEPMVGDVSFVNITENLLRYPGRVVFECGGDRWRSSAWRLAALGCLSLALFGFLLGTFSGGTQLWAAPLKVVGGTLAAVLICLPSLYIFSALAGMDAHLRRMGVVLAISVCLSGLLLLGFAPVVWVFSTSIQSLPFMGFLALSFWLIALFFGINLLQSVARGLGLRSQSYLNIWTGIFVIVLLQMPTSLRPIIGTAPTLLPTEKRFFLEHWIGAIGEETPPRREGQ